MTKILVRISLLSALVAALAAAPVSAQTPWVHIEVDEGGEDESHVKVNLPLSVVEIALEAAPEKILKEGRIHLHHVDEDIKVEDLRRMWQELEKAGDTELVSVQSDEETVSIRREGDHLRIDVDPRGEKENVQIQVPVSVVNALFAGQGPELDLKGAISELKAHRGDLVRVTGGDTKVRIWIDERN